MSTIEIKIPPMGESITEVIIGSILINSGSTVKADDPILEIETDKVNQLIYAPKSGTLSLKVQTGETVRVGQTIGTVIEGAEGQPRKPPKEEKKKEEKKSESEKKIQEPPIESKAHIRKTKEDFVKELQKSEPQVPTPREQPVQVRQIGERKETRKKMSTIRKVIAKRLVEAQQTTAMLTTFNEIDMTLVIDIREKYKENFMKKYGVKLGFMSFFIKAVVSGLQVVPDLNSYIDGEDIVHREYYDIGVAVGTERGLIVPVLRDCDQLTFAEIEQEIIDFANKAKEGKLAATDLQGGGFTITNGGVYGSLLSTPILNPPQCGILGMHKIEKRPIAVNDQVTIHPMMYVALSYDHRIVDGKEAVTFLVHVKDMLENPARLLLNI